MAGQTLETVIAINAKIGNGFSQVGATLTELGTMVDGMSRKLINFGKESLDVYQDYEKSMHEAEVALATSYGQGTKELSKVMDTLDAQATKWAASTIFHTDDVANAISQAAHAGWDLDQILNGLPVAMELAQAGSMDLSESLTYITKTMAAFDVPYDELGEFVDMWVYAANSSVGDVQDFGDAMKKMGATMRFTDSKEELFALIGLMHDMGESGSTAATLLRTSMMRILAPSGVASKVMEQLGATDEEINEIREDASKMAALNLLESYGFSAFDEKGQAKPIIDIYAELGATLAEIAGGYENITKNQTTLGVLGTIFGTRGITGALDIVTALQKAVTLRDELLAGKADDYGQYAAETMMDTLYGKTEIFESKIERLKQVVGEELSGQVESVMENVGGIVDKIAEMDEGQFSALVSGLEVIAAAGPGLLLAGGAFRLIGYLLTPAGGIGLGLTALAAAATAIQKLQEADLKNTFGDMEMDTEGITSYIKSLGDDFRAAWEYTDHFQDALQKAVANYREASSTFGSNLFSLMIKNVELTPDDYQNLLNMGQKMYEYAEEALYTAASGDAQYWAALFGGEEEALKDPIYQSIIEKTNQAYEESQAELKDIGTKMREAITKAYSNDWKIDESEYGEILSYFREYNALVAKAAADAAEEENQVKMQKWLLQAQTGSWDDVDQLARTAAAERSEILQKEYDMYMDKKARLLVNGGTDEEIGRVEAMYQQRVEQISTQWDNFMLALWDSQLSNNGQMENWNKLKEMADWYLGGSFSTDAVLQSVTEEFGKSTYSGGGATLLDNGSERAQLAKITGYMLQALGGKEELQKKIDYYNKNGNTEMAERLRQFYAMEQLANGFYDVTRTDPISLFGLNIGLFGDYETNSGAGYYGYNSNRTKFEENYLYGGSEEAKAAQNAINEKKQELNQLSEESAHYESEIAQRQAYLNGEPGSYPFAWSKSVVEANLYGTHGNDGYIARKERIDQQIEALQKEIATMEEEAATLFEPKYSRTTPEEQTWEPVQLRQVDTGEGAADRAVQLKEQGVEVKYTADTTELEATIDAEDGQTLTQYLDGDATDLHMKIWDENGQQLTEEVTGDPSELAAIIQSFNGQSIRVKIYGDKMFAQGGRATEASIFGEAGPEWAIPEQHSERTAELLNAARAASGFTWGELLEQFGGLNANPQKAQEQTTIVYSPTINATDASSVEQVLKDDKRRFEKWYEEKKMRDEAEVYA